MQDNLSKNAKSRCQSIDSGFANLKEPLIKSFLDTLSYGFSSVGNDGFAFNQRFLNYLLLVRKLVDSLSELCLVVILGNKDIHVSVGLVLKGDDLIGIAELLV